MAAQDETTSSASPSFSDDHKNGTSNNSSRPSSELAQEVTYTEKEESKLIKKGECSQRWGKKPELTTRFLVDWALLPGLTFLYLLSFLDRANGVFSFANLQTQADHSSQSETRSCLACSQT